VHRPQAIQAAAVERRRPAGVLLPRLSRAGAGLVSSVDATGTRGARSARGRGVQPQHRHAVRAVLGIAGRGAGTAHRSRGRLATRFRLAPPVTYCYARPGPDDAAAQTADALECADPRATDRSRSSTVPWYERRPPRKRTGDTRCSADVRGTRQLPAALAHPRPGHSTHSRPQRHGSHVHKSRGR
jgi:hypothetical protein